MTGKADREGLHLRCGAHGHYRHQAGVHTAAQQHANRYVGHQLATHGILE